MFYYPAEKNIPIKLLIDFDALEVILQNKETKSLFLISYLANIYLVIVVFSHKSVWPKESDAKGISSLQVMYAVDIDLNVQ